MADPIYLDSEDIMFYMKTSEFRGFGPDRPNGIVVTVALGIGVKLQTSKNTSTTMY